MAATPTVKKRKKRKRITYRPGKPKKPFIKLAKLHNSPRDERETPVKKAEKSKVKNPVSKLTKPKVPTEKPRRIQKYLGPTIESIAEEHQPNTPMTRNKSTTEQSKIQEIPQPLKATPKTRKLATNNQRKKKSKIPIKKLTTNKPTMISSSEPELISSPPIRTPPIRKPATNDLTPKPKKTPTGKSREPKPTTITSSKNLEARNHNKSELKTPARKSREPEPTTITSSKSLEAITSTTRNHNKSELKTPTRESREPEPATITSSKNLEAITSTRKPTKNYNKSELKTPTRKSTRAQEEPKRLIKEYQQWMPQRKTVSEPKEVSSGKSVTKKQTPKKNQEHHKPSTLTKATERDTLNSSVSKGTNDKTRKRKRIFIDSDDADDDNMSDNEGPTVKSFKTMPHDILLQKLTGIDTSLLNNAVPVDIKITDTSTWKGISQSARDTFTSIMESKIK